MRKFLSFDKLSGLLTTTAFQDGKNHVGYEQDVEPHMDVAAEMRLDTDRARREVKDGFMHAAFIPDSIILKMMFEDGVSIYNKGQRKEMLRLLDTKYPKFKTVNKRLA